MRRIYFFSALFALCLSLGLPAGAQVDQSATGIPTSAPPEERQVGGYATAVSIEAGYRFVDLTSTAQIPLPGGGTTSYSGPYNTFVDQREGPRVFEQSLSMRSVGQAGVLFDNLFVSSFGWGGDPENVARLRVGKRKFYDFTTLFRRDYMRFDYNLLANPLNPPNSSPTVFVFTSPHRFDTVRRMTDVNLTLAPLSPVSVRLGYHRNRMEGDSRTTDHMPRGTDIENLQPYNVTNNGFRAGIDLKFFPRTTLSFDGILNWFKHDTFWELVDFPFTVGGIPTNLGISWNTLARQPCAAPFNLDGTVNPLCNQATSFFRQDRFRNDMRDVMASLQSRYWQRLDISARAVYGWSDLDSVFFQDWTGVTATGRRQTTQQNPQVRRVTTATDLGLTFHLTDSLRISDSFRFENIRRPAVASQVVTTFPGNSILIPPGLPTLAGRGFDRGLFTNAKVNEVDLEFDATAYFGGVIGYRYAHREIELRGEGFDIDPLTDERDFDTEAEFGLQNYKIPEHTGIAGIWIRPSEKFRLNLDAEFTSAGIRNRTVDPGTTPPTDFDVEGITTFLRVWPRHQQQYRARATVIPERHVTLTANLNIREQRNSLRDILYRNHNRNYGFNATILPNERILFDLAYNYQDFLQNNLICVVAGTSPGSFPSPTVLAAGPCLTSPAPYLGVTGDYNHQTHFGSATLRVKPIKRLTLALGYSIVLNDGSFTEINALQPIGPLQFNFHRPLAEVEIGLAGGLALKGGWNYYGYNEKGEQPGPTLQRDFHANTGTIVMRYSF